MTSHPNLHPPIPASQQRPCQATTAKQKVLDSQNKLTAACAIQDCLTKNGFAEGKCQDAVLRLYKCCDDMYRKAWGEGKSVDEAKSDSCPIPDVVQRKLKKLEAERNV